MSRPSSASGALVTCVGAATWDTIARVDGFPAPDSRVEALDLVEACGGPAATAAVTLARLGVRVAFAGVVGDDDAGRAVRHALAGEGVDVDALRVRRNATTARSVILVSGLERTIVTRPAAAPVPAVAQPLPLPRSDWYHVDHLGWAMIAGGPPPDGYLSVDHGNPIPRLSLERVDLYVPTAARLTERYPGTDIAGGLRAAIADGAGAAVATMGAQGSVTFDGECVTRVPAAPVTVVSTLGAGDVFHGAVLAGILAGLALPAAARLASAAAAAACTALDGQSAIPHRDQLPASLWRPAPT